MTLFDHKHSSLKEIDNSVNKTIKILTNKKYIKIIDFLNKIDVNAQCYYIDTILCPVRREIDIIVREEDNKTIMKYTIELNKNGIYTGLKTEIIMKSVNYYFNLIFRTFGQSNKMENKKILMSYLCDEDINYYRGFLYKKK